MEENFINGKGLKRLKSVNRAMLATIAALALGLWTPKLASATLIAEIEPNNTGATAQNVNGNFSLDFDANINDNGNLNTSTTIPHVSIRATGNGTYDFYRFTSLGGTIILDIDLTPNGGIGSDHDTEMGLWDAAGNLLVTNDDGFFDTGSSPGNDDYCASFSCNSFIQTSRPAGDYIVGVCRFNCSFFSDPTLLNLITGEAITADGFYTLHISTAHDGQGTGTGTGTIPAPEPSAMLLLGSGLLGLGAYRRHRNGR